RRQVHVRDRVVREGRGLVGFADLRVDVDREVEARIVGRLRLRRGGRRQAVLRVGRDRELEVADRVRLGPGLGLVGIRTERGIQGLHQARGARDGTGRAEPGIPGAPGLAYIPTGIERILRIDREA